MPNDFLSASRQSISTCSRFQSSYLSRSQTNTTQSLNHWNTSRHKQLDPATSNIDVDGGLLPRALLQADVAAHVKRLSLGDVHYGQPINHFLPPHLPPVPQPLHLPLAPALQFKRFVEIDDKVVLFSGGDNGLAVACNETERTCHCGKDHAWPWPKCRSEGFAEKKHWSVNDWLICF